eukprot:7391875-Prymnesium_polylepis.2
MVGTRNRRDASSQKSSEQQPFTMRSSRRSLAQLRTSTIVLRCMSSSRPASSVRPRVSFLSTVRASAWPMKMATRGRRFMNT